MPEHPVCRCDECFDIEESRRVKDSERGYDIATARAENRRRLGLPIDRQSDIYCLVADGAVRFEGNDA